MHSQQSSSPPLATAADDDAPSTEGAWIGDPELEAETRALIAMLDYEIGRRWMSLDLRLQLEKIEIIIGERGTASSF